MTRTEARAAGVTSFGMGSAVQSGDLRFTHSGGLDSYSSFSVIFPFPPIDPALSFSATQ